MTMTPPRTGEVAERSQAPEGLAQDADTVAPLPPRGAPPSPTLSSRRLWSATGILGAAGVVATVWLGLWATPPDAYMHNLVRLLYIHPSMAWDAFLAYGVAFLASAAYLWPRTRDLRFDRLAGA
ncbi:MAG: cytochrome c assembly protein, partial [Acidimicrobiaceae bacterium]|nr:cytochrome c assembly protein [Acidimicrobiaceae bacterium]